MKLKVSSAAAALCVHEGPSVEKLNASFLVCAASKVSLPQVARVLSEVYGDRMASHGSGADAESFPLQQKLLVCCLLLLLRNGKTKEVVLGKVRYFLLFEHTMTSPSGLGLADKVSPCTCFLAPRGVQPPVCSAAGICGGSGRVSVSLQFAGEPRNLCIKEGQRGSTQQGTNSTNSMSMF